MATLRQPARDLPLVGTGSRVLSPAERFPRDFWLTPRTVLTRKTPMSKLQTFCIRHGKNTTHKESQCIHSPRSPITHSSYYNTHDVSQPRPIEVARAHADDADAQRADGAAADDD